MRRTAILLVVAAIAIGLCELVAALWNHSDAFLAKIWEEELEDAPDRRMDAILRRLEGLDEAGVPALATALASSRQCVAKEAARALRGQAARWQSLPPDVAAPRQREMAQALANVWPNLGPSARRDAVEIVEQLLAGASPDGRCGDAEFLAACAEVLRAGALSGVDSAQGPARPPSDRPTTSDRQAAVMDRIKPVQTPGAASALDIPSKSPDLNSPGESDGPAPLPTDAGGANSLPGSVATRSPAAAMAGALSDPTSAASNEPRRLSPVRQASFDGRSSGDASADAGLQGTADLRQFARRLCDGNPQQAEAAREELQRRGLSAVEVDLARQLFHPDAAVRKKLARALPETVGVDAAPWLLELSRDADGEVRLEAITLLATTGDPALLEALRKLIAADPDERIQRLSGRLSRTGLPAKQDMTK